MGGAGGAGWSRNRRQDPPAPRGKIGLHVLSPPGNGGHSSAAVPVPVPTAGSPSSVIPNQAAGGDNCFAEPPQPHRAPPAPRGYVLPPKPAPVAARCRLEPERLHGNGSHRLWGDPASPPGPWGSPPSANPSLQHKRSASFPSPGFALCRRSAGYWGAGEGAGGHRVLGSQGVGVTGGGPAGTAEPQEQQRCAPCGGPGEQQQPPPTLRPKLGGAGTTWGPADLN